MAKVAKSSRKKSEQAQSEVPESQEPVAQEEVSEAQSDAPDTDNDNASEAIEDAEVLSATASQDPAEDAADMDAASEEAIPEDEASEAEPVSTPVAPDPENATPEDDTIGAARPGPAPAAMPDQPAKRRGGLVPLLIGGLAAGGLGYGVETYLDTRQDSGPDLAGLIEDQSERIDALGAEIESIPPAPDLAPLQDDIEALDQRLTERIEALETDLSERIDGLDARLTDVEKRPDTDGTLSDTAMAAYERELDALRADLAAQREDVTAIAEQAAEDLSNARAEAEQLEQQALQEARAAAGRAALNRLRVAVAAGDPFDELLGDLQEVAGDLPASLTASAETGVADRATLEEDFGSAARAALAAAREEGVAGETGGLGTFLRQQFDVRSTQPRAGSDPDAVLSRAEAAVEEDRLADALAELATLPDVARAEMTGWTAKAQARADALAAISDLSQSLNTN